MMGSEHFSAIPDELQAIDRAFADRRHDAERYRQEAVRLRCEAQMEVNATIAVELTAVARHFDELAATVETMQARHARPAQPRLDQVILDSRLASKFPSL